MKTRIELFISERVKYKRKECGISQAALARLLGVSKGFVGQAESRINPTKYNLNHLNELSGIFKCSISEFFPSNYIEDNLESKSQGKKSLEVISSAF